MTRDIVERLREAGWSVAVHNDYKLDGERKTFWLFTHTSGVWAKGEGYSDAEALAEAEEQAIDRLRAAVGWQDSRSTVEEKRIADKITKYALDKIVRNQVLEEVVKYILTCGRIGPLGGGPDPVRWLIEDHAALVRSSNGSEVRASPESK